MKITIHCKNLELTPAIEEYVNQKIGKVETFFKGIVNPGAVVLHVELASDKSGKEGNQFVCEVTGFAPKKQFRISQSAHELYAAIDLAEEKLEEQARKYKERNQEKNQK
jgi:putative sigma-54 modulation protein